MDNKLNITIKIADIEPINFAIDRTEEEIYRKAEYHVNNLWEAWKKSAPERTSAQILARIALAFAELYYRKSDRIARQEKLLGDFEKALDNILLEMPQPQPGPELNH